MKKMLDIESTKKEKLIEDGKINNMGLFLQFLLMILIIIVLVMTIFIHDFIIAAEILMGLTLMVMGYNNYKIYHRKYFTGVYLLIGILLIGSSIIMWFNAI